jgi:predicted enzyme related to lactoylglutathione lyase
VEGGFDTDTAPHDRPPLVVLYARDLEAMLEKVTAAGGAVTAPIYAFPGGRRFHFRDPAGNELAVWSPT